MKKNLLLGAMLLCGFAASAQLNVIKDAERAMKDGADAAQMVEILTPAFSNPETAQLAQTWYLPGKAGFKTYDDMLVMRQLKKLDESAYPKMDENILIGYEYYMKALPLDSFPDAKGKVKPKYSKEIINTIAGHYNDYYTAGYDFYQAKDYAKSYDAWQIYQDLSQDPRFKASLKDNRANDTILAELAYNQALAAYFAKELDRSIAAFRSAIKQGYDNKSVYDFGISVALENKDQEAVYEFAQAGLAKYGKEEPQYMAQIVNYLVNNGRNAEALDKINTAIAEDPNNSQYYVLQGVLLEDQKGDFKPAYKKAIELNPENATALYHYGRILCEEAYNIADNAPTEEKKYMKVYEEQIAPLFREAAEYLEKAYTLDDKNPQTLRYLKNIYYNLHDEEKVKEIESLE